jgi:predicted NAD/FAD-dependent oxidoreductase
MPSNHAVCKSLSEDLISLGGSTLFGRHAKQAAFGDGQWEVKALNRLDAEREEIYNFDALVLSDKLLVLPNQYAVLGAQDSQNLAMPQTLESRGQIALLLAFNPPLDVEYDLMSFSSGSLELLVRDSGKPGREGKVDVWTARSSSSYAVQHLDTDVLDDEAAVQKELLQSFMTALGIDQQPVHASVFAWDHAQPSSCADGVRGVAEPTAHGATCGLPRAPRKCPRDHEQPSCDAADGDRGLAEPQECSCGRPR